MLKPLQEFAQCPACGGELVWTNTAIVGSRVMSGDTQCLECKNSYPVRDELALFLTPDLQREDLWEESGGALAHYLDEHPDIRSRFLHTPLEELAPIDRYFRGLYLRDTGKFEEAEFSTCLAYCPT